MVTIIFHDTNELIDFMREDTHDVKRITAKFKGGLKTYTVRYMTREAQ